MKALLTRIAAPVSLWLATIDIAMAHPGHIEHGVVTGAGGLALAVIAGIAGAAVIRRVRSASRDRRAGRR